MNHTPVEVVPHRYFDGSVSMGFWTSARPCAECPHCSAGRCVQFVDLTSHDIDVTHYDRRALD